MSDNLTIKDICFFILTVTIILIDIILALCICFIIPKDYDNYQAICQCENFSEYQLTPAQLEYKKKLLRRVPFIVSIAIQAFEDSDDFYIYIANGIAIQSNKIFVLDILDDHQDWLKTRVRADSIFWSKEGDTYRVKKYESISNNIVLHVDSTFKYELDLEKLGLVKEFKKAAIVEWPAMIQAPLHKRFFHMPINVTYFTSTAVCKNATKYQITNNQVLTGDKFYDGRFLIDICEQNILGFGANFQPTEFFIVNPYKIDKKRNIIGQLGIWADVILHKNIILYSETCLKAEERICS